MQAPFCTALVHHSAFVSQTGSFFQPPELIKYLTKTLPFSTAHLPANSFVVAIVGYFKILTQLEVFDHFI